MKQLYEKYIGHFICVDGVWLFVPVTTEPKVKTDTVPNLVKTKE